MEFQLKYEVYETKLRNYYYNCQLWAYFPVTVTLQQNHCSIMHDTYAISSTAA